MFTGSVGLLGDCFYWPDGDNSAMKVPVLVAKGFFPPRTTGKTDQNLAEVWQKVTIELIYKFL